MPREAAAGRPSSGNTLIVYSLRTWPLRSSVREHLYSLRRYGSGRYFYLNLPFRRIPRWAFRTDFDTIVFHSSFLSQRWSPAAFAQAREAAEPLKSLTAKKVALPQDEFLRSDLVSAFIDEFAIDCVLSVAPESELSKIYAQVNREDVRFERVLTGYLDERTVARIRRVAEQQADQRPIDIGYRAKDVAPWLGRHGRLKGGIARAVEQEAQKEGLATDISIRGSDTLLGDDWYRFLASCKYTIGVEGGSSVLDHDGSLKDATEAYLASHPEAEFEEVEAACFPGRDGEIQLVALSPRHLEACATKTCQILVSGEYNGVLQPGVHFIELHPDLSNLDEVLAEVRRGTGRSAMVERAYLDVVGSGRFTYRAFAEHVERASIGGLAPRPLPSARMMILARFAELQDVLSWVRLWAQPRIDRIVARTPEPILAAIRLIVPPRLRRLS